MTTKLICKYNLNRFIVFVEFDNYDNIYIRFTTNRFRTVSMTPVTTLESLKVLYKDYTRNDLPKTVVNRVGKILENNFAYNGESNI